jgi:putative oxidoreductase
MLLLGWYVWIGALILVVFLVPVALVMHNFWAVQDSQMRTFELVQFTKNVALAGALLRIAAVQQATGWNPLAVGP